MGWCASTGGPRPPCRTRRQREALAPATMAHSQETSVPEAAPADDRWSSDRYQGLHDDPLPSRFTGTTTPSSTEGAALADRAMDTLRRSCAAGMSSDSIERDHDLDPLRDGADFRDLILDRDFPSNPIAN